LTTLTHQSPIGSPCHRRHVVEWLPGCVLLAFHAATVVTWLTRLLTVCLRSAARAAGPWHCL